MKWKDIYREVLEKIRGKTIAVVYVFEGENAPGYGHYDVWRSSVISVWLKAIEELRAIPYLMDLRTFIFKAMAGTLPVLDYVINLNSGETELSTLGLLPSACTFLGVPCIPCKTTAVIAGEHKRISNLIAYAKNIKIPAEIVHSTDGLGIFRPMNCGSSKNVKTGKKRSEFPDGVFQEFIRGVDITTPIMFNPRTRRLDVLPTIMYSPLNHGADWFFNEKDKECSTGYVRKIIEIGKDTKKQFLDIAEVLEIRTYCRIDARIQCESDEIERFEKTAPLPQDVFFLEINPMPTLEENVNFLLSIEKLEDADSFSDVLRACRENIDRCSLTGFVLSCAIAGLLTARYNKTLDYKDC